MNKSSAQYRMRQPRKCQIEGNVSSDNNPWESWYYVGFGGGLDVMVRKPGVGTVAVKLTKRQLEQALALFASAQKTKGVKP